MMLLLPNTKTMNGKERHDYKWKVFADLAPLTWLNQRVPQSRTKCSRVNKRNILKVSNEKHVNPACSNVLLDIVSSMLYINRNIKTCELHVFTCRHSVIYVYAHRDTLFCQTGLALIQLCPWCNMKVFEACWKIYVGANNGKSGSQGDSKSKENWECISLLPATDHSFTWHCNVQEILLAIIWQGIFQGLEQIKTIHAWEHSIFAS